MALVTKQYLYEAIAAGLEGGQPSAGKKFEARMIQAHLQQVINRRLKTEYVSATLPSDETIPEGLVLACYDNIPVESYKGLSRAKLPAMPVSLRRNMGVYFVGPATQGNITPEMKINIESQIGGTTVITGTTEPVTGLTNGSTVISCNDFVNGYFNVFRGGTIVPEFSMTDGDTYYTKNFEDGFITLSSAVATGEFIKIQSR